MNQVPAPYYKTPLSGLFLVLTIASIGTIWGIYTTLKQKQLGLLGAVVRLTSLICISTIPSTVVSLISFIGDST
jgi:hypothetical protein